MKKPSTAALQPAPRIGGLEAGPRDALTDVPGVTVGHCTLDEGDVQTGVTVVCPHDGDAYLDRVPAASVVLNGFGKSVGLMQVNELGVLDTPIALTNTFAVGTVAAAQIRSCVATNPGCGRELPTVNPLVFECNDGALNDIQRPSVQPRHYDAALAAAGPRFDQGSVGAGRGMCSFGLKAGIGSASRAAGGFTLGALVLANFGRPEQLVVAGQALGPALVRNLSASGLPAPRSASGTASPDEPERGSVIVLLGTDAPLDARQLRRVALRAGAGLARTGSVFGHGSGDIALAFTTAYTVPLDAQRPMPALAMLHDSLLDGLFQAAADATEQAIVHALWYATAVTGRTGTPRRPTLREIVMPFDERAAVGPLHSTHED